MKVVLAFFLLVLSQAFDSERHALDLEPLLQDPATLQRLTVVYRPPIHKGWIQLFFVRGDGSLILQAYPDRPMAVTDIPTLQGQSQPGRGEGPSAIDYSKTFLRIT